MIKQSLFLILMSLAICCQAQHQSYIADTSFAGLGIGVVRFGPQHTDDRGMSMIVTPNGHYMAAGYTNQANGQNIAVCRIDSFGFLDGSFGGNNLGYLSLQVHGDSRAEKILFKNGKSLIIGETNNRLELALLKLNYDGSFDTTFANRGVFTSSLSNTGSIGVHDAQLTPDSKIVVSGYINMDVTGSHSDILIARFLSDGRLDSTFNNCGYWIKHDSSFVYLPYNIFVQNDHKIMCSGTFIRPGGLDGFLYRLNENGTLDTGFGTGGFIYEIGRDGIITGSYELPDHKILATFWSNDSFKLTRLLQNGTIDTNFSNHGQGIIYPFGSTPWVKMVEILPSGKILLSGYTLDPIGTSFVVRYNANGTRDATFAYNGINVGISGTFIEPKYLPSTQKIVYTGQKYFSSQESDFAMGRLLLYTVYAGVAEPQSPEQSIGRAVVSPNPVPAGAAAGLQYELPEEANIRVALYDIQGRELAQLQSGHRTAGKHEDEITMPSGLAAGMYFVTIATDTGKMVSVKVMIE